MVNSITARLLAWYDAHQRELPWRQSRDPYAIWVSEIMLHQTQVATVLPYYRRFLARFPTVGALAAASLDDVLKEWEGLGYYTRARHLHAAAQRIVREHGGRVPDTWETLAGLPGVGAYTADAILSIAYGQDRPAVDGNVRRVLSRVFRVTTALGDPETERELERHAWALLPSGQAGEFNQALMDLGATICTPAQSPLPDLPPRQPVPGAV